MHRKRKQTRTMRWFKAFHRLHQAHIALLNQIRLIQTIAIITARNRHHHAQMRQNQLFCRFQIAAQLALRQRSLLFQCQHRDAVYRVNILLQATMTAWNR